MKTTYDHHLSPTDQVQIRWMIRRDMAEILCIEEESFEFLGLILISRDAYDSETALAWLLK